MDSAIAKNLKRIVDSKICDRKLAARYIKRIEEGSPTRDENPDSHICAYFAAYDPKAKQVLFGHHRKSGHWLFNGGHIDKGENPEQAIEREIWEEWGIKMSANKIGQPRLLTITEINRPSFPYKTHYDIWYFVSLDKNSFKPDKDKLEEEFYKIGWLSVDKALELTKDRSTKKALKLIRSKLFRS